MSRELQVQALAVDAAERLLKREALHEALRRARDNAKLFSDVGDTHYAEIWRRVLVELERRAGTDM